MEIFFRITMALVEVFMRLIWALLVSVAQVVEQNPRQALCVAGACLGIYLGVVLLVVNPAGFLAGLAAGSATFVILRERLR